MAAPLLVELCVRAASEDAEVIDATGHPPSGIKHVLACCTHGKHVVMVNVEADVLACPGCGYVYDVALGDPREASVRTALDFLAGRSCTRIAVGTQGPQAARSTTARTLIDLSAVFGAPDGIKAILVKTTIRDSGSAGGDYSFSLTPASGSGEIAFTSRCSGLPNDSYTTEAGIVPCDANGDVYYQIAASGTGTMDVTVQIWGYLL